MSSSGDFTSQDEQKNFQVKDILIFKLKMILPSEDPKFKPEQRHFFKNV